jgi:hypothetical protein
MIFTNQYFIAVGIPFLLILLGAIARKLIRSTPWIREDFFLGVDLCIAGISSGLIYIFELITQKTAANGCPTAACRTLASTADERLLSDAGFLVFALFFFMLILSLHQDQIRDTGSRRRQWIALGVVSNLAGVIVLGAFILMVKGVGR